MLHNARRHEPAWTVEIALDVEDVQFTFDLVDGYANPADVDTPPVGNSPAQIRKVNLKLATRSRERNATTGRTPSS